MNTIFYSQDWFDQDIGVLITQLKDKQFDVIVGVNRGGCIPAVCLSHALKIPCTMVDYSLRDGANINLKSLYLFFENLTDKYTKVLIVDDLVDSGQSLKNIIKQAMVFTTPSIATLLHNRDVADLGVPHYYGTAFSRSEDSRYFDFWWETYSV